MPSKMVEGSGRADLFWLENLDLVQIEEGFNHRIDVEDDDEFVSLKASIKEKGVLQPLVFIKNKGNETVPYVLRIGERRLRACRQLRAEGWQGRVPFTVRVMDEKESVIISIAENFERDVLSPIEESNAVGKLSDFGFSNAEIARTLHRDPVWIGQRLTLRGLHSSVKNAVHKGKLPVDIALDFARKVPLDEQEEKLAAVLGPDAGDTEGGEGEEQEGEGKKKKSVRKKAAQATGKKLRPGKKEVEATLESIALLKESAPNKDIPATKVLECIEETLLYANGEIDQENLEKLIGSLLED